MSQTLARPRFHRDGAFQRELTARVEAYLSAPGRIRRDLPRMYRKTAVIFGWFAVSWGLLVFAATSWWVAVPLAVSLGLAVAAIGTSVMHDANHGSYSRHPGVNRALGWSLDAMGASSYIWRVKHNAAHHTWTNLDGHDNDIDLGVLGRLAPTQPHRPWHRLQHVYLWALYGFLWPKWVFFDDARNLATGHVGTHALKWPRRGELAALLGGKLFFALWALVIPMVFHGFWPVALAFSIVAATVGVTLAVTFQLAHCVDVAGFPDNRADQGDFAAHQIETTVDFARGNRVLTWFMGGLNHQVEHHLFPKVCHLHYPALAPIVEATAAEFGLQYRCTRGFWRAVASHARWLRAMGRPVAG